MRSLQLPDQDINPFQGLQQVGLRETLTTGSHRPTPSRVDTRPLHPPPPTPSSPERTLLPMGVS